MAIKRGSWITHIRTAILVPTREKKSSKKVVRSTQRGGSWIKKSGRRNEESIVLVVARCENRISCVNPFPACSEEMS